MFNNYLFVQNFLRQATTLRFLHPQQTKCNRTTHLPPTLSGRPGTSSWSPHLGKTIIMAVSNGTHPGSLHETCMTITVVPISRASSGMVFSIRSTIRRLCWRSIKFSLAENIVSECNMGVVIERTRKRCPNNMVVIVCLSTRMTTCMLFVFEFSLCR